jgi:hypothetical protein
VVIVKGSWLPIDCQRRVATPHRPEVWDIVAGGWVPDGVMKTYTDARLAHAPTCALPHPDHDWALRRWRRNNRYRVTELQTPQRRPHLGTGLATVVNRGQWVRIVCQARGQKVLGSRL